MIKSQKYTEAYLTTLAQHKELIKNNAYARELEQKYHKIRHQSYKANERYSRTNMEQRQSLWPIESSAFTEILRSKLSDLPIPKLQRSHIGTRFLSEIKAKNLKKLSADSNELPKINPNRYWSPPNLNEPNSLLIQTSTTKLFGPKVKRVRYSIKNLY